MIGCGGTATKNANIPMRNHTSGAGRCRKLQFVFLSNLKHSRNILLLVRTQCADFLEESFEARRGDDT